MLDTYLSSETEDFSIYNGKCAQLKSLALEYNTLLLSGAAWKDCLTVEAWFCDLTWLHYQIIISKFVCLHVAIKCMFSLINCLIASWHDLLCIGIKSLQRDIGHIIGNNNSTEICVTQLTIAYWPGLYCIVISCKKN